MSDVRTGSVSKKAVSLFDEPVTETAQVKIQVPEVQVPEVQTPEIYETVLSLAAKVALDITEDKDVFRNRKWSEAHRHLEAAAKLLRGE